MVKVNLERLQMATNGEVETIELMNGEFVNSDMHKVRVYQLNDGDVFSIKNEYFEYNSEILHELVFDGYEHIVEGIGMNPKLKRTGKSYTVIEFNEKVNKGEGE